MGRFVNEFDGRFLVRQICLGIDVGRWRCSWNVGEERQDVPAWKVCGEGLII